MSAVQPIQEIQRSAALASSEDALDPPDTPSVWPHAAFLIAASIVIVLACLLEVPDERHVRVPVAGVNLPELCMMRRYTGVDCPGCGLTRCFVAMAHGQFTRAWQFQPAGILWFAAVAFQIPYRSVQLWRIRHGREEFRHPLLNSFLWLMLAALIGQWVWRMTL